MTNDCLQHVFEPCPEDCENYKYPTIDMEDKNREKMLNEKLKKMYDVLIRAVDGSLDKHNMSNFKVQVRVKLNGAYRFGLSQIPPPVEQMDDKFE